MLKTYSDNSDPKLRGHVATVIGAYLRSLLHLSLGRYTHFASKWTRDDLKAEDLIEHLVKLSTDESHLVLRSLCTAAIVSGFSPLSQSAAVWWLLWCMGNSLYSIFRARARACVCVCVCVHVYICV